VKQRPVPAEVELARELLEGHADAFDRFVSVFQAKIFAYSYLMCGQRQDAEEVAQETLLSVFENYDQLRAPEHVKSWVFRIARNNCLMKRRKSLFAPVEEVSLDEVIDEGSGAGVHPRLQLADAAAGPDILTFRGELRDTLDQAIRELPPTYRAVVLLRDVEELTTEETAEILDVSEDVVKTRLHRARLALREQLGPQFTAVDLAETSR
jgi:RNA polymerase sigma-70 factor (ECF subfamily)